MSKKVNNLQISKPLSIQGTTTLSWSKVPKYPQLIDIARQLKYEENNKIK